MAAVGTEEGHAVVQIETLPWASEAKCLQAEPDTFFPEKGGSTREAKRICAGCDVRAQCLEYALDNDERFGIWGGMSERERRRLKRLAS
ncbi:MAG: WhiB family transcriptional regulator [Euzebyales bacterium]|nr:WhiB family transcriptional regulator [Euzebyales bacterium]